MQTLRDLPLSRRSFKHILIAVFSVASLVGCGSASDNSSAPQVDVQTNVGTNGQLISIQSDNVAAAGYDVNTSVMIVQFRNGALYEYYGVPLDLWDAFIAAQPNPWSQVGYPRLVQAGIPYKRIR
jgi:hypothetical protein